MGNYGHYSAICRIMQRVIMVGRPAPRPPLKNCTSFRLAKSRLRRLLAGYSPAGSYARSRPGGVATWQSRTAALTRKKEENVTWLQGNITFSAMKSPRKNRGIATPACALARNDVRFIWRGISIQTTISRFLWAKKAVQRMLHRPGIWNYSASFLASSMILAWLALGTSS